MAAHSDGPEKTECMAVARAARAVLAVRALLAANTYHRWPGTPVGWSDCIGG